MKARLQERTRGCPEIIFQIRLPTRTMTRTTLIPDKVAKRQTTDDSEDPGKTDDTQDPSNSLRRWHFPLPTELILAVVSHISVSEPIRDIESCRGWIRTDLYEEQAALKALSQTSRMLRNVCLPILWQRVRFKMSRAISYNVRLERIITGLIDNPALANFVRIFEITIVARHAVDAALISKLITCLSILHNMHTLYFYLGNDDHDGICEDAFSKARFPQVRTLIMPACYARIFVPCCPQVRTIIATGRMKGWTTFSGLLDESGQTLEQLEGFTISSPDCIKYLTETAHNLKIIKFRDWINPANLLLFEPLKKLHTIHMSVIGHEYRFHSWQPLPDTVLDEWMAAATQVLAGNQGQQGQTQGGKRIRMSYRWIDHINVGENQQPLVKGRFEDVEVD